MISKKITYPDKNSFALLFSNIIILIVNNINYNVIFKLSLYNKHDILYYNIIFILHIISFQYAYICNRGQNFAPVVNTPSVHTTTAARFLGVLTENYVSSPFHFPFASGKKKTPFDITIVF